MSRIGPANDEDESLQCMLHFVAQDDEECDLDASMCCNDADIETHRTEGNNLNNKLLHVRRTSMDVFKSFIKVTDSGCDVSGILSRHCYNTWVASHAKGKGRIPEESFRKALMMHLTRADDTSTPFPEEIESKILRMLRQKRIWTGFRNTSLAKVHCVQLENTEHGVKAIMREVSMQGLRGVEGNQMNRIQLNQLKLQ